MRIDYAASVCVINNVSYKNLTFIKSTKQLVFLFVFLSQQKDSSKKYQINKISRTIQNKHT